MNIETSWVEPPTSIMGLDHVGSQAPCLLIYGQLLPGITNVTDRARYYSLYTWIIWSYDRRYPGENFSHFIEFFRRADCLLTLISERHSRQTDNDDEKHGTAMVGRRKLLSALDRLENGGELNLSEYTTGNSALTYFKNRLGGLGQYYAGTLINDLGLLNSKEKRPWFAYTKEYGEPLAEATARATPHDHFWSVVEADNVSPEDLDDLKDFCACALETSVEECSMLQEMFFDSKQRYGIEGVERRRSLGLILSLIDSLPAGHDISEDLFRACCYSGTLPDVSPWEVPEPLKGTMNHWRTYVRNDLVSIACQTLFAVCLRSLESNKINANRPYETLEAFCEAFPSGAEIQECIRKLGVTSFGELVGKMAEVAPDQRRWDSLGHEIQLGERLIGGWKKNESDKELMSDLLRLVAILALRDSNLASPYANLLISSEDLGDYPINLVSFRQRASVWSPMTIQAMLTDFANWCLNTHLKVALRKLRQTNRSTFHLRPSERGLEVVNDIPPPARTSPRFRQSVQVLRDIKIIERDLSTPNRQTKLSPLGKRFFEVACG